MSATSIIRWSLSCILLLTIAAAHCRGELPRGIDAEAPTSGPVIAIDGGYMVPYTAKIPGSDVEFTMLPVPAGTLLLGSADSEPGHKPAEGPLVKVAVAPFWISKYELTWAEYKQYMAAADAFQKFADRGLRAIDDSNRVDAVTAPSKLYEPSFTFGSGEDPRQPAVSMSQFAAKQYTKWLSLLTGESYRLPSEAEWEYACRGGTTTAYWFGDDAAQLGEHEWNYENADDVSQPVGKKSANPWGLFDMHGNVAEWTLDAFTEDGYKRLAARDATTTLDAVAWPQKLFPRVVRGGSFYHDAIDCRSASRIASDDDAWRSYDPNVPKSPWWLASDEGQFVGMRIVRVPGSFTAEQRHKYWEADVPSISEQADKRIDVEGRGERGIVDKELPAAIERLKL